MGQLRLSSPTSRLLRVQHIFCFITTTISLAFPASLMRSLLHYHSFIMHTDISCTTLSSPYQIRPFSRSTDSPPNHLHPNDPRSPSRKKPSSTTRCVSTAVGSSTQLPQMFQMSASHEKAELCMPPSPHRRFFPSPVPAHQPSPAKAMACGGRGRITIRDAIPIPTQRVIRSNPSQKYTMDGDGPSQRLLQATWSTFGRQLVPSQDPM